MRQLFGDDARIALASLGQLDYCLAARSVALGLSNGAVYVDDATNPHVAIVRTGRRWHLAGGDPRDESQVVAVSQLFSEKEWPRAVASGDEAITLNYAPASWGERLGDLFPGVEPIIRARSYWERAADVAIEAAPPPEGIELREPTRELVEEGSLEGLDALMEEMRSERTSVDEFLARSFGLIAVTGNALAGWCLSEYNVAHRCEVGIATMEPYRRRGVATAMATAFVALARRKGVWRIGWHAWADNAASLATARRAGFSLSHEHNIALCFLDLALAHAVRGNQRFDIGDPAGAAQAYEHSLGLGTPPSWAIWNAACAHARAGNEDRAIELVGEALRAGAVDRERVLASPHLEALHGLAGWRELVD
jgi:RimJ/RimL family protein N-acetyltransferase